MNSVVPFIVMTALGGWVALSEASQRQTQGYGFGGGTTQCIVQELESFFLVTDNNTRVHIETTVAEASTRNDVLLLGVNNYLSREITPGNWQMVNDDSVFGAVLRSDGTAQIVRSPISTRLVAALRAVAMSDGTWAVVFAELDKNPASGQSSTGTKRLWAGTLSGVAWSKLEALPVPDGVVLSTVYASPLVRHNSAVAWALPQLGPVVGTSVFTKAPNRPWLREYIQANSVMFPSLGWSKTGELMLYAVHPDHSLMSDRGSLFVWGRGQEWEIVRKIAASTDGVVQEPTFFRTAGSGILVWQARVNGPAGLRREARMIFGDARAQNGRVVVLDSSTMANSRVYLVPASQQNPLFVVDHQEPGQATRQLRIVEAREDGSATVIARFANSNLTKFAPAYSNGHLLIFGSVLDKTREIPVTLVRRFRIGC